MRAAMVNDNDIKLNISVKRAIESGIKPIEITLCPIFDLNYGEIKGYKAELVLKSVVAGTVFANEYFNAANEKLLNKLALRAIKKAAETVYSFKKSGVDVKMLFIRMPASFIYSQNVFGLIDAEKEKIKNIKTKNNRGEKNNGDINSNFAEQGETDEIFVEKICKKICLCFDEQATFADDKTLSSAFSDIRAAGFKTALSGYGGDNFAIEKVINACPDYVFASRGLAELCQNREKSAAVAPLINLIKSLGGELIAENVFSDDELREFRARDCFGFIPASDYNGRMAVEKKSFSEKDAINDALSRDDDDYYFGDSGGSYEVGGGA